jgi:hypothetical protein
MWKFLFGNLTTICSFEARLNFLGNLNTPELGETKNYLFLLGQLAGSSTFPLELLNSLKA